METPATAKIKGQKNGLCNRTACQSPNNVIFYNTSTKAYYCPRCARHINEFNHGVLCVQEDPATPASPTEH